MIKLWDGSKPIEPGDLVTTAMTGTDDVSYKGWSLWRTSGNDDSGRPSVGCIMHGEVGVVVTRLDPIDSNMGSEMVMVMVTTSPRGEVGWTVLHPEFWELLTW